MSTSLSPFGLLSLKGKVALVTGGTSGIGARTAELLAIRGAAVIVAGRRRKDGEAIVSGIRANGGAATFIQADVSIEADVKAVVEQTVSTYGRLDIAFNNAGIAHIGAPHSTSTDVFDNQFNINVRGLHFCMKYEAEQFLRQRKADGLDGETSFNGAELVNPNQLYLSSHPYSIINNASVVGIKGHALVYAYSATKHAVIGLTRSAALSYAKFGIRVNAVNPGVTWSEMASRMPIHEFIPTVPMGRIGQGEEIAEVVAFLASTAASFVTGTFVGADGGASA